MTEASEEPKPPTRAAALMGAATAASRGIGFIRIWVIATVLGTTYLGNTYQSSSAVSNVLFELLAAGALSAVLVPTFVRHLERQDDAGAEHLAAGVLGLALAVLGVIALVGFLLAPQIAHVIASGAPEHLKADQQQLATYLTRFFVFQVLLYAIGTVSTAVLFAKRRFVAFAMAPIANTVAVVAALVVFRLLTGPHPTLHLDGTEELALALGGMLGVLGFVAVPTIALARTGFRLRPRLGRIDSELRQLLKLSTWAVLQHGGIGILLAAAIAIGNRVEGGVIAYQFAFVAIMAPYGILAEPVHTTILPELSRDAMERDHRRFASQLRWALDNMAILVVPVSAVVVALALPMMRVVAVGQSKGGAGVLSAALASLALGLYPNSAFLLFARALYALDDSRTPAVVALLTAVIGATAMVVIGLNVHGDAIVAATGIGHTLAYTLGSITLAVIIRRRLGHTIWPRALLPTTLIAGTLSVGAWIVHQQLEPKARPEAFAFLAVVGVIAGAIYLVVWQRTRRRIREVRTGPPVLDEPDLALEE
ncbi:MAG: murein biosynthesis integral membrane protein MurJ [Acidimicrobiia bacterium]